MALHPSVIPTLGRTPATLRAMLEGMPAEAVDAPGPEGWSAREVVAHLLSIHDAANVQRLRFMLDQDNPEIPNVDEEAVLQASGMRAWSLEKLLDEYAAVRGEAMSWISALSREELERTGRHQVAGEVTIADILHHIAYHDLLHIAQVATLLGTAADHRRGAMREAFPAGPP
jgi:hypothetical protein